MEYSLEPYQEEFVANISEKLKEHQAIIAQLTTGGGKTVVFATLAKQFIDDNLDKGVIIFVHRGELLEQTIKTLQNWHNIEVQTIEAKPNCYFSKKQVYVAMIETFNKRIKDPKEIRLKEFMKHIGLVIVDEAHRMEFTKIFDQFTGALRIGFTATPIGARKKDPLINYYTDIVIGLSVKELIEINKTQPERGVVQDVTYTLENVNRNELAVKGNDFDDTQMGVEFSKMRQIQNTIDAYVKHAFGKKMLCFNANVEHSKKVTEEMCKQGLNARHLDASKNDDEYRKECFQWLKTTPNAILCNIGIATTGFDDPSVEGVIINKATKSLTLYKQMCGRSARPYKYPDDGHFKTDHIILDMGDNAGVHGVWSEETNWEDLFLNPHIPGNGIAPVKKCPECKCMNAAAARICKGKIEEKDCGYVFPIKTAEEDIFERDMIRVTNEIDIKNIIELFKDRREYFSYYELIKAIAKSARNSIKSDIISQTELVQLCKITDIKVDEWIKLIGKADSGAYKRANKNTLLTELNLLGFIINNKENNMQDLIAKINQARRERANAVENKCTPERYDELTKRLDAAEVALKEYKYSLITPEQKAAFSLFEDLQTKKALLNAEFIALQDKMIEHDIKLNEAETTARLAWPEKFASTRASTQALKNNRNNIKTNPETSHEDAEIPGGGIKIFSNYKGGIYEAIFFAADNILYNGIKYTSPTTPARAIAGSVNGWLFWKHKVNGKNVTIEDLRK